MDTYFTDKLRLTNHEEHAALVRTTNRMIETFLPIGVEYRI